jgi:hypothetical protein
MATKTMEAPASSGELPADEPDEEETSTEGGGDDYAKAGQTIRHAMSDGDDEGLARAICDLIDIHTSEDDSEEPSKKKPNLAAVLIGMKKKGK